jgi:hypothetical protein
MYQPMLYMHWKQIRLVLIPLVLGSFALPLVAVAGLGAAPGTDATSLSPYVVLDSLSTWLPFFPGLALAIGIILALSAWNWDHQLNHVYALSLPLTRMEYALLKMGAGAALALLPVAAMWLGANVAAASVALPPGLHAYPNQLAIRFLLATLIAYSTLFAMAAGTVKTSVWIVGGGVALLVVGVVGSDLLMLRYGLLDQTDLLGRALTWFFEAPGPFEVFSGNWSLIDV